MLCANLLKRSKNYKTVFYCKKHKRYINISIDCESCSDFILKRNKPIKKVSKKKVKVSKETYQKVYERDKGICQLCGSSQNIEAHHIRYRSERKDLIDEPTNLIFLCKKCHILVHSNKHYWQSILLEKIGGKNVYC